MSVSILQRSGSQCLTRMKQSSFYMAFLVGDATFGAAKMDVIVPVSGTRALWSHSGNGGISLSSNEESQASSKKRLSKYKT